MNCIVSYGASNQQTFWNSTHNSRLWQLLSGPRLHRFSLGSFSRDKTHKIWPRADFSHRSWYFDKDETHQGFRLNYWFWVWGHRRCISLIYCWGVAGNYAVSKLQSLHEFIAGSEVGDVVLRSPGNSSWIRVYSLRY